MHSRWLTSLNLNGPCWICVALPPAALSSSIDGDLRALGYTPLAGGKNSYALRSSADWSVPWRQTAECLTRHGLAEESRIGIVNGENPPTLEEAALQYRSKTETDALSEQLWLLDVIENDRLACHFLPVVDHRGATFGYESLVRATSEDGSLISGGAIFQASRLLRIEHLIDRHLHELAIQTFTSQQLSGFLFINLVPGFIQRPEFYFGTLAEAARQFGMQAKNIVLECTNSENPRDIQHLSAILRYCRSQGYLVSLDDITTTQAARRILQEMQPDFIKLDMQLVQKAEDAAVMATIRELVELTRNTPSTLIAEGVETETVRQLLEQAGIHLYQGYLFPTHESSAAPNPQQNRA